MLKERALFPEKKQAEFIKESKIKSNTTWRKASEFFGIKYNTFRAYSKENTRMSLLDFKKICKKLQLNYNTEMTRYSAKIAKWSPENAFKNSLKIGANKTELPEQKIVYGTKEINLELSGVNFSKKDADKKIILPNKISEELAEETGMHLGDGFLSGDKYEFRLKGGKDEISYYKSVVKPLYKKLYNIEVNLKEFETTFGFELYSKAFWQFKAKVIGFQFGKKTDIQIPNKIKVPDTKILCALVRGYFDTDGCMHFRSQNKHKKYYPVITAASQSKKLAFEFKEILNMLGFNAKFYSNKKYYSIVLNGYANFKRYMELIGWHSPKHLEKVNIWIEKNKEVANKYGLNLVAVV